MNREGFLMEYGLQLYSVRDVLKQDYQATLKAVAEMGYKMVELIKVEGVAAETV